jgi:hypothetical protein
MKLFIAVLLVAVPVAAQAMGMHGRGGGMGGGGSQLGLHAATFLYALVAALGYWVLQHADKDTRGLVRKTGQVVAWVLIVLGLMGLLCGIGAHVVKSAAKCGGRCPSGMMEGGQGMQGGGGGMQGQPAQMEKAKTR